MRFHVLGLIALLTLGSVAAALPVPVPEWPADPLPGAGTTDPALVGQWSAPIEGLVPAISAALLSDGRILYWGGVTADDHDQVFFFDAPHEADVAIIAPPYTAADVTFIPNPPGMGDLFCAGLTIGPDGNVFVAGGSDWKYLGEDNTGFVDGVSDTWIFDTNSTSWIRADDMDEARWYPTIMTLADGSALAASGLRQLPQAQTHNTAFEQFVAGSWSTLEGADNLLPMYPRLFTVPSGPMKGDVFFETVGTLWGPFGEHPTEGLWNLQQVLDRDTNQWQYLGPSVFGARQHAATVMLPLSAQDDYTARLLTFGGSIGRSVAATPLAEMTTLGNGGVDNAPVEPLAHPRWHVNGVLLPDGSVLAVGGGMWDNVYAHGQRSSPVLVAERFDPATGEWSDMAPMSVGRTYHSTAILMPDGRVMAGGHVPLPVPWRDVRDNMPYQDQIAETRLEIYEPPYLHWNAERPVISDLPDHAGYGQTFQVESPQAENVVDAILVHPGATTHAWDVSQRAIVLPVLDNADGRLTFQAPPDGDVAMPGYWMLFLRVQHENGLVPGVAEFIHIG